MRYLLDTNVLSDARRQTFPELNAWLASQVRADLTISIISLLEIERGILQVERRDASAGQHLRAWLEAEIMPAFSGLILPIDVSVARTAAGLHVPDPMPEMDALIAATAIVHDLILVTHNTRDFERTGIRLLDPRRGE
ncbi:MULTISPECIES: type II toxin-antitoxin system VapC family toxin [Actinomyces]|uniref:Ribonuclease VapC n=1 Tax=Actinomyces massiliensis F0489 TaxID=1125718 RepID=J1H710_9ACTO|nr:MULTISPECIES: type II toxin-antitoxin system VapC family toxin [Actinomyces]EJF41390.1 PIN domain protein [Actinomyces massiliensis F0489]WLD71563.1 type II toxin-antitoxin system VapC family toxin [Actinomyces massiliensis]